LANGDKGIWQIWDAQIFLYDYKSEPEDTVDRNI
jgi:hypothetical protein